MQGVKGNREFKELLEKVYEQKFDNKSYIKKMLESIKTIPTFIYDETTRIIRIELKEDEILSQYSDLGKFYNTLQNISINKSKEVILEVKLDEIISKRIVNKYIDIIHFADKPNTKYYTKKYFKEKILVELQALEDILEYVINKKLNIKLNQKDVETEKENFKLDLKLDLINEHYYLILQQDIKKFKHIIQTNNYMYIYYNKTLYRCDYEFIKYKDAVLQTFLKNYKNDIHIYKKNLTNFFSLIYPNIKEDIKIKKELFEGLKKYIPQTLVPKLYLDFDNRNYLIANLKFCYANEEFNPVENKEIKANRNLLEEAMYLNKLIKTGFLLDKENKRFIINLDDVIYNFLDEELDEYIKISQVYTTENFNKKNIKKTDKTSIGMKINNNLLELDFTSFPIDKKEIKDILQKYKLSKKYYRLKDGSFVNLEHNKDIEFLSTLADGLDISYKNIEEKIILPMNRALYLDKLLQQNTQVEVKSEQKFSKLIQDANKKNEANNLPEEINKTLRNYQKTGYNWLTILDKYEFGGILADDMGLGKTIQILAVLLMAKRYDKEKTVSLVVAPSSLTLNWKSETEKFAKDLKTLIINGNAEERKSKIKRINNYDLIITSYDSLKRDIEEYDKLNYIFRYVIADEAQYIKNNNTQNSKVIKRIKAKTRFALTGTPIENSLSELWSIFDFIMPGYLFTYKKFKTNYETPIIKEHNEDVLNKLKMIIEPFILRRTKKDVLKELPDKATIILNNEMEEEQRKIYLAYLAQARNELREEIEDNGFEQSRIKILTLLTRLRQICCHPSLFISNYKGESGKLNQCIELVKESVESGHKMLLFSGYTSMFEIIEQSLKTEKINYLKLTGKTNVKERFNLIEQFNNNEDIKVFLISLKAGGTGINLTSADMVIHYDPWWNLSVENQATDRTHRIGQTKKVQVYKLITKNSIEEKIYELQQRKKELIDNMLSTDTKFINKLSREDIIKLFE